MTDLRERHTRAVDDTGQAERHRVPERVEETRGAHRPETAGAPGRPRAGVTKENTAVRLDAATLDRVDALIPGLSTEWLTAKRSDVLRKLILEGLAVEEKRASARAAPPGAPRRRKS